MEWLLYIVAIVFTLAGAACVVSVALGIPGTWIMLGLALLIELLDRFYLPEGDRQTFAWWLLITCIVLAGIGELLEFLAGALGAKKGGSSKRGMWGAVIGGIAGAIIGAPFGLVIGAFAGALIGTFLGAILGEMTAPDMNLRSTMKPAVGATVGRLLGTLSKLPIAVAVWIALSVSAFMA